MPRQMPPRFQISLPSQGLLRLLLLLLLPQDGLSGQLGSNIRQPLFSHLSDFCESHHSSCCSVRPSGSESLPGVETHDAATYEDVSTCAVTDFQVLDSIPEQTPATGEHPSFGSEFYHCCMLLLIIFPLLDMDIDFDVDPTPAVDETTIPATSTQTAPEAFID